MAKVIIICFIAFLIVFYVPPILYFKKGWFKGFFHYFLGWHRMKIKLDDFAIMPTRAHRTDAGLDIYSPIDFTVEDSFVINTGVHVELPAGTVGFLKSKSGLNVNYGIVSEGVIDEGYTGAIRVKLYNNSGTPVRFKRGEKITQLVILPCIIPEIEQADKLDETERGDRGFGSTGY